MLTRLIIQDYALIEHLDVDFQSGFSVITGETGAGKSIILGAMQLLLGARSDSKAIKQGAKQCKIEAHFDLSSYRHFDFFDNEDFEFDGSSCIITRIVSANGKSRSFINDVPASVAQLKVLGEQLVDIHSQHKNLLLHTSDFQLSVLDTLAHNQAQRDEYRQTYTRYHQIKKLLDELTETRAAQLQEADFMQFQFMQLYDACLVKDEETLLEQEAERLRHAQELQVLYQNATGILSSDEGGLNQIRQVFGLLNQAASLDANSAPLAQRVNEAYIELKDIASEIESAADDAVYDPERLQIVEERLDMLNSLMLKHRVNTSAELIAIRDDLDNRLQETGKTDETIEQLTRESKVAHEQLLKQANELTQTRASVIPSVIEHLHVTLASLGMPNADVSVEISHRSQPSIDGMDDVLFTIATNKNSPHNPLSTLSGGEAARVMLAIKDMLTGAVHLPTIIFDEIDTGVSGRIAESMAAIMQRMGKEDRQVISITHLPQIAARGSAHYRVYKEDGADETQTHIIRLTDDERVHEIAAMLSGDMITDAAIENAKSLLQ